MALYTRLWAAGKHDRYSLVHQPASTLTSQAALELINATSTPTHTEIKLAYSLWKNQLQCNSVADRAALNHQVSP